MPELSKLLKLIESVPEYRRLLEALEQRSDSTVVALDAAKPYLVAALYESLQRPVLVVTAQPENAKKLHEQLLSWSFQSRKEVKLFPEPDVLPYERLASDTTTGMERIQVLSALAGHNEGEPDVSLPLVVASAAAVMSKTTPHGAFISACCTVKLGMDISPFNLLGKLEAMGYQLENVVEVPGAVSHRGGIIDIFPATGQLPVRLEFFGDTIDSIRSFDPTTQRSIEIIPSVTIGPATELMAPRQMGKQSLEDTLKCLDISACTAEAKQQFQHDMAMLLDGQLTREAKFYSPLFNSGSLLDYLPSGTLLVLDEPSYIEQTAADLDAEAGQLRSEKLERGELPRNFPRPYFSWEELGPGIEGRQKLSLAAWGVEERLDFISAPGYAGKLPVFLKKAAELLSQQKRIIIVSHQASRLSELLAEENIIAAPVEEVTQAPGPGALVLVQGSLPEGWVMSGDTHLFTDAEIFGFVKQRRLVKKRSIPRHKLMVDIIPDDYVVHVEHGIGKFTGVTTLRTAGVEKEYLVLHYAAGDIL
jgi:transcription-repair coupling factor (superfamily II helicase)